MAKIITDPDKIKNLLTRGVEEVIVKENLEKALVSGRRLRIKLGIDPTSPNIHIGRAIALWKLRAFQDLGHKAIFIVGDFTGLVGDTSDKEAERPMLSEKEIKTNLKTYFNQAFKILDKSKTETYYNSKWLSKLKFLEINELANLFGLHEFESREVIARRLKAGKRVSLHEMMYPLMQGYDSVAVKADVELGGTDQKFNLLAGRTIQESYHQSPQNILMTSILDGLDGRKMSSSWGNTINITDAPNEMFGKVMTLKDELIATYFKVATIIDEARIPELLKLSPREAKLNLAEIIVAMYHGQPAGQKAKDEFIKVFSEKQKPEDIPMLRINAQQLSLAELLVKAGLASSKSEARRLIEQGGVKVDDIKKTDPQEKIDLVQEKLIQVGPRRFVKVSH